MADVLLKMKFISLIICFLSLMLTDSKAGPNPTQEKILQDYLTALDKNEFEGAKRVIENSHYISISYTRDLPMGNEAEASKFALSLKASYVMPISLHMPDGRRLPQIIAAFSKVYGDAQNLNADDWLTEMRRPIDKEYSIKNVYIVLTPSKKVIIESFQRSEAAIQTISAKLEALKRTYPQLRSYNSDIIRLGDSTKEPWPIYPSIHYRQDISRFTKAGPKKTSSDWCSFGFSVNTINGNPFQSPVPTRRFPRQGIFAFWHIQCEKSEFVEAFNACVKDALKALEEYEQMLENEQNKTIEPTA